MRNGIKRKQRVWATTTQAMANLGSGATRLAQKSASRLSRPSVARCLGRLRALMALERACKLRQGDVLVELIDGHGLRPIDLARVTGRRPNELSERYHTSKMFPPAGRRPDVQYNSYLLAMRMSRKFRNMGLEPAAVLEEILSHGFTQHRDVTRYFSQLARAADGSRAALLLECSPTNFCFNRTYHARFQSLRHLFAERAIKILNLDPPYVYAKSIDVKYRSRSARSLECDSSAPEEAVALVVDVLRDWQSTLAPGGVLLLWQPAQLLLRPIADAIDAHGWEVETLAVWDKGRPQPGAFDSPYSTQCEHLLVLKRRGDTLINHDHSSRGDILRFPPVSRPGMADAQEHGVEKPVELCRFLVGKHSFDGELVVDLCGCTGAMSLAALEMSRRWVYVESSLANYRIAAGRIAQLRARHQAKAS